MNNFIIRCTRCGLERAIHSDRESNEDRPQTNIKITTYEWKAEIKCKCGNKAEIQSDNLLLII